MAFHIRREKRTTTNGLDGTFYLAEDPQTPIGMEIWPALGFNCVRWYSPCAGRPVEWLHATPQLLDESRPTRSGIPILFPFPNRIRAGQYGWENQSYQLEKNDPAGANAIHGFACHHPWRVLECTAEDDSAWITGEFWASKDGGTDAALWPADYRLRVTYRLRRDRLRIEAHVANPDSKMLPFGLGYHPYFQLLAEPGKTLVEAAARSQWELQESLPTGRRLPVAEQTDLRQPRPYSELQLDDLLTDIDTRCDEATGLRYLGRVVAAEGQPALEVHAAPVFRDLVVFTPPHRQAICLEPYTCPTDAIHLQQKGIEAGWLTLAPGAEWSAAVELRVTTS